MTKLIESNYEMVNGKYYLLLETGKRPSDEVTDNPNDIASLGGENISEEGFMKFDNVRYITKKYFNTINKGKIQKEDILINKDGAQTGKIAYISEIPFGKSMINEHIFIIRNNGGFDQKFLFYFLLSFIGQKQIKSKIVGSAQGGISNSFIKGLYLPKPKKSTQEKIASILSTVDNNIEQTKKTIEKAERLKKSMMQNLLSGKIKPDGSKRREDEFYIDDKFGQVPKGWEIKKGWQITNKITKGQSPKWQGFDYCESGALFITSENIKEGYLDIYKPKFLPVEFNDKLKNSQLKYGDILINIVGASIGRSCLFKKDYKYANINQAVCLFRLIEGFDNDFFAYFLQLKSTIDRLMSNQVETARANLSLGDFRKLKFIFPSDYKEQIKISKIINILCKKINSKKSKLVKLQKLKKSLMQNLLTGKFEVK
ncbi:MAG TPA: restriction endonuclease subunit S [Candidatus Paceibacterota bacterium]|nr:restriction endonuclease subunit S [Candidatus Paceibacterota bacterium]